MEVAVTSPGERNRLPKLDFPMSTLQFLVLDFKLFLMDGQRLGQAHEVSPLHVINFKIELSASEPLAALLERVCFAGFFALSVIALGCAACCLSRSKDTPLLHHYAVSR